MQGVATTLKSAEEQQSKHVIGELVQTCGALFVRTVGEHDGKPLEWHNNGHSFQLCKTALYTVGFWAPGGAGYSTGSMQAPVTATRDHGRLKRRDRLSQNDGPLLTLGDGQRSAHTVLDGVVRPFLIESLSEKNPLLGRLPFSQD